VEVSPRTSEYLRLGDIHQRLRELGVLSVVVERKVKDVDGSSSDKPEMVEWRLFAVRAGAISEACDIMKAAIRRA